MDKQERLIDFDESLKFENFRLLVKLEPNKKSLEEEKKKFMEVMSSFLDSVDFGGKQNNGRPKFYLRDVIKSLATMSYNGMSYKRIESDLHDLKEKGLITNIPKRSTLNKYMLLTETRKIIEKLIQISSMFFIENEDTLILDSTWLAPKMYTGGYQRVYNKKTAPLLKVRKLHVSCLKNSRIICCAKASLGNVHDSSCFKELVHTPIKNGFEITKLLADAGYTGKDNYAFCRDLNILNVFIDFRKNVSVKRAKSQVWRTQLKMFKENPDLWHENYRFRVIVEGVFSSIKRKHLNYLRSRKENAQDVELLLKCLVYNFEIIGKYF